MEHPVAFVVHQSDGVGRALLYGYDENGYERCAQKLATEGRRIVIRDGSKTLLSIAGETNDGKEPE